MSKENQYVYIVMVELGYDGYYGPITQFTSVWEDQEDAQQEVERLKADGVYSDAWYNKCAVNTRSGILKAWLDEKEASDAS